jgi:hypothetical protein
VRALVAVSAVLFATGVASPASARPTEVVTSLGIVSPTTSPYRYVAETLGYDRRGFRHVYEAEAAVLHGFTYWLSVGPVARFYYGDLSSPYEPVPAIATYAGSLGARAEVELFPSPRLFLWADPHLGVGVVGDKTLALWGVRGGVGIGSARSATGLRFRIGYGESPTFNPVTANAGPFNYGGFIFQLDGVFRVAR